MNIFWATLAGANFTTTMIFVRQSQDFFPSWILAYVFGVVTFWCIQRSLIEGE